MLCEVPSHRAPVGAHAKAVCAWSSNWSSMRRELYAALQGISKDVTINENS